MAYDINRDLLNQPAINSITFESDFRTFGLSEQPYKAAAKEHIPEMLQTVIGDTTELKMLDLLRFDVSQKEMLTPRKFSEQKDSLTETVQGLIAKEKDQETQKIFQNLLNLLNEITELDDLATMSRNALHRA